MYRRWVVGEGEDEGSPGEVESGEVEWVRGECRAVRALVVAPLDVVVVVAVMVRGEECVTVAVPVAALVCVVCEETCEVCLPCCWRPCCWSTEWARKAERKDRNGWFVGISSVCPCLLRELVVCLSLCSPHVG